jgi:hypothetical protein
MKSLALLRPISENETARGGVGSTIPGPNQREPTGGVRHMAAEPNIAILSLRAIWNICERRVPL